ncbi:MAG: hypothetical protein WC876_02270 [Candidatus Thermoplasmatota archaeon]
MNTRTPDVEVLTLNLAPQALAIVVPRRLVLRARPGIGTLSSPPAADNSWRASVINAWDAACALTGRHDVDLTLALVGPAAVSGGSAGLPFGLAALALLLNVPLRPVLGTGEVLPGGYLRGGRHAQPKAEAAAAIAAQRGWARPLFLTPPLASPPQVDGIDVRCATDLGDAFSQFDPESYAAVAARHHALRRQAIPPAMAPADGAFLHDGRWHVCSAGEVLWVVPEADATEAAMGPLLTLAGHRPAPS